MSKVGSIFSNLSIFLISVLIGALYFFFSYFKQRKEVPLKEYIQANKLRLTFSAFFVLGILSRTMFLDLLPRGLNQDELSAGYDAYAIAHFGKDRNGIVMPVHLIAWGSGQNALYSYLMIPFVLLFGLNPISLRLPMGMIGSLTLFLVFDLCKRLTKNEKVSLFFMLFVLINPWHLMKSRWALEANIFPDLVFYGVYLLIRGYKEKKDYMFYISSFILGLSSYSYGTSYFFLFFFIITILALFVFKYKMKYYKALIYLGIIGLTVIPIILFIYVNVYNKNDIHLLWFTVPHLNQNRFQSVTNIFSSTFFKDSFQHLKEGLKLIITQNDHLPWNQIEGIGTIYFLSLPFTLFGLFHKEKENEEILWIFRIFFIVSIMMSCIVDVNINRFNIVYPPLIFFTFLGIYSISKKVSSFKKVMTLSYAAYFIAFMVIYTTSWNASISYQFYEGFYEACRYASSLNENCTIYTTSNINMPYVYALFADETDVNTFIETVQYANEGAAFEQVKSFGNFVFSLPYQIEENNIYIVEANNNKYQNTDLSSYEIKEYGHYLVINTCLN